MDGLETTVLALNSLPCSGLVMALVGATASTMKTDLTRVGLVGG